jgi:aspartate/methionine/tyrosine aminotransferase
MDTYLSVSTPVQIAASRLIESGRTIRAAILSRVRANLDALRAAVRAHPAVTLREPEGGWSAVLEVPATMGDEALVLKLVETAHVIVHPGYFFDFEGGAFLVVSLLPDLDVFRTALDRVLPIASRGGV